jgi:hypothetical protein
MNPENLPTRGRNGLWLLGVLVLAGIVLAAPAAFGQGGGGSSDLTLTGGNLSLTFLTPAAGSDLSDVVDNTSCALDWSNGPGSYHITAQTNVASPTATLRVRAINVFRGTSSGVVTLSTTAQNFVVSISQGMGNCDLEYTASASLTDGPATDVHTVTFTMTSGGS